MNFKWEYRIIKNFSGNLKLGVALNQEVKNNYYYPTGAYKDYSSFFGTFNPGFGCNYFINIKTAIYINYEVFILGNSRDDRDWVSLPRHTTNNNLFNIGIKYNFKK